MFATASALHTLNQRNSVTVDLRALSWMTQIPLGFDQASEEEILAARLQGIDMPSEAKRIQTPRARRIAQVRVKLPVLAQPEVVAVPQVTTQDQVIQTAAKPLPVDNGLATDAELKSFQMMHLQLHREFVAGLGVSPSAIAQVAIQPEPVAAAVTVPPPSPAPIAKVATNRKIAPAFIPTRTVSAPVKIKKVVPPRVSAAPAIVLPTLPVQPVVTIQSVIVKPALVEAPVETIILPATLRKQTEDVFQQLATLSEQTLDNVEMATQPATPVTPATEVVQTDPSGVVMTVSNAPSYAAPVDYSSIDLHSIQLALNTHTQSSSVDPNPVPPPAPVVLPAAVVEAFDWKTEIADATPEVMTLDGWKVLRSAGHWPGVYWNADSQAQGAMISNNTALMLALKAEASLQAEAGIVFGKIPAGWNVEFSGRSEKAVYLDDKNQPAPTPEGARYFAFVNAAPGGHIVSLAGALGAETASVGIAVISGFATYVDLTAVSKRVFSGHILDAGANEVIPVAAATVSIVGQSNAVSFTTRDGSFRMPGAYAISNYPIFVETKTATGFNHRYRITPAKMEDVNLFRIPDAQIQTWVGQLEGGLSPDSGLVVGALPKLTRENPEGRLFPLVHPLVAGAALTPETYTLTGSGQMEVGKALERTTGRFVSVQVSDGPIVTQVEDNNHNVVWSELTFAQPGVVNVVGPY